MNSENQLNLSLMSLFQVGAHRGNKKSKLNPKLKSNVYTFSSGLALIDLTKTIAATERTANFFYQLGRKGKQILLVGTDKYIQSLIPTYAQKFSNKMPYISKRWLGGILTNWKTVCRKLRDLEKVEGYINNKDFFNSLSKPEQLSLTRKYKKLEAMFAGLRDLKNNKPGAVFIFDMENNPVAISESGLANIPVVGFTNTGIVLLPKVLDYTIVFNNKSLKAVDLLADLLIDSYNRGLADSINYPEENKGKQGQEKNRSAAKVLS